MHGECREAEAPRGGRQAETLRVVLHQPRARSQFRLQDGERRHRCVPMRKRILFLLATAAWSISAAGALADLSRRPFAVAGGEGGGGGEGGLAGWLIAEQSLLTHLMAEKVHALHGQSSAAFGLVGLGLAYGV